VDSLSHAKKLEGVEEKAQRQINELIKQQQKEMGELKVFRGSFNFTIYEEFQAKNEEDREAFGN
jgi:hypothetical protein